MNKTGTSGERASLITANPRIVRSAIKIIIDSVKETFFFFIFIFLQIKNPVDLSQRDDNSRGTTHSFKHKYLNLYQMVTVLNFSEQHYNDVFRQTLPVWFAATTSSLNAEQSCYFSFLVEQYDSKIKKVCQ